MKKIFVLKPDKPITTEEYMAISEYVIYQYNNNQPIIVPHNYSYQIIECSEPPMIINIG